MYKKISLNGIWKFQPGTHRRPEKLLKEIKVPALVDLATPEISWEKYAYFWYYQDFFLTPDQNFKRIYLQLEQVMFGAEIYVNDKKAGADIPCYTSQEFDITRFVKPDSRNEILIRVGTKNTLPSHSAVGNDYEKPSWIPGIWGDVWLHFYGPGRVKWTRIIPDIQQGKINLTSYLENLSNTPHTFRISYEVLEKKSQKVVVKKHLFVKKVSARSESLLKTSISLPHFTLWSPENPFLYSLRVSLVIDQEISHQTEIHFGMRRFDIHNGHFYLNNERRVLMGSNIPFHRLLSDPERGGLPWDLKWIKKALVDIPKSHHMFFFRFHLGHAYNRWYDIADEYGIMLQDEWMFWTITGSYKQIEKEFTDWVTENINHPSIVIWDALNETKDQIIQEKIIPKLKKLDPTRPWELVDFPEDHPYIYSLGPVLNDRKFGYARSILELGKNKQPTMVNEYLWWWLDQKANPTFLTEMVIKRWLGYKRPSGKQLLEHQAFLAAELTELWRRLNVDAIMPFVYLSSNRGATANWFLGQLKQLRPKPILTVLKNVFSPVGISLELWDRHFLLDKSREVMVYFFNDTPDTQKVDVELRWRGHQKKIEGQKNILLRPHQHLRKKIKLYCQGRERATELEARLKNRNGSVLAITKKPVFIFQQPLPAEEAMIFSVCVHDVSSEQEIKKFLKKHKFPIANFPDQLKEAKILFVNAGSVDIIYKRSISAVSEFVKDGGILILQEPEFGIHQIADLPVIKGIKLMVHYRQDVDQGGYDSYVFPVDIKHPLWKKLKVEDFKMFNGGFGGEIVSQYNVRPTVPYKTLARCHLDLKVPAVMEISFGKGWIIISRIQIRGRLIESKGESLYQRRYDPVAEQYFWNLLHGYLKNHRYQRELQQKLQKKSLYISKVIFSPRLRVDIFDTEIISRWTSDKNDLQFLKIDLGRTNKAQNIEIYWEIAEYVDYNLLYSEDDNDWHTLKKVTRSTTRIERIDVPDKKARYYRMEFTEHGRKWGLSSLKILFS